MNEVVRVLQEITFTGTSTIEKRYSTAVILRTGLLVNKKNKHVISGFRMMNHRIFAISLNGTSPSL